MNIRVANRGDIDSLLEIERKTFDKNSYPLSKKSFIYHIKKEKLLIALVDDKIVGYILNFFYKSRLRIYSIAVLQEYQNQKIGFYLVNETIKIAKAKNYRQILLEVNVKNQKAVNFYQKIGFQKVKILKNYYIVEDGYKMRLLI